MRFTFACIAALAATPCAAQVRIVVAPVPPGAREADVFFLNGGAEPAAIEPPAQVQGTRQGSGEAVTLSAPARALAPAQAGTRLVVAPGGFAKLTYEIAAAPEAVAADTAAAGAPGEAAGVQAAASAQVGQAPDSARPPTGPASSGGTAAGGFIDRFEAYEPVFVIVGDVPDATKMQFSFAFRFLDLDRVGVLRFGYTQTMFWATGANSWPFTSTTYSPSIYHSVPVSRGRVPVDLSLGYAHDSTGEGGRRSRDVNRIFVRAAATVPIGGDWSVTIAPSLWRYVDFPADRPPGIARYRGNASLELAIGRRDGPRLSSRLRGSLGTGRGSAELNASLPMRTFWGRLPPLYLFSQLYTGYGETLIDYDRESTQLRFGFAFVR